MIKKNLGKSYVVRIYRWKHRTKCANAGRCCEELAGIVEHPISGSRQSFQKMQHMLGSALLVRIPPRADVKQWIMAHLNGDYST